MIIIHKPLPATEYYAEKTLKKQIVLHHTVSSTSESPINWWKQDGQHISVSYIITKNGNVIECFNPDYWSYHIGKGSTTENNKSSIGIEIVNEGILQKSGDSYTWLDGKAKYTGEVFDYGIVYRGGRYFAKYTEDQVTAVSDLLKTLTKKYSIPVNIVPDLNYDKKYFSHNGILSHRNLRPDKTDVSPAFNFKILEEKIK